MITSKCDVDGITYHVHHNSDWSGDAIVCAAERPEIRLPGRLLLALGETASIEALGAAMIDLVEQWPRVRK